MLSSLNKSPIPLPFLYGGNMVLDQKRPMTNGKVGVSRQVAEQVLHLEESPTTATLSMSDAPTTLLSSTAIYRYTLQRGSVSRIKSISLRFLATIASSPAGGTLLNPTPMWMQRIDLLTQGSVYLRSWFADALMFDILSVLRRGQFESIAKAMNFAVESDGTMLGQGRYWFNGQYMFDLPLPTGIFEGLPNGYLSSNAVQDLILQFTPNSGAVASSSGTITLNSLQLLVSSDDMDSPYVDALISAHQENIHSTIYLEQEQNLLTNVTANTAATTKLNLQPLSGKYSHLICVMRPNGTTNTVAGDPSPMLKMLDFGTESGATIDLTTPAGQSIIGDGAAVPYKFWRYEIVGTHQLPNDLCRFKNIIVMPFSQSIPRAYGGAVRGYMTFHNEQYNLNLYVPATATNEVQTFTISNTTNSGGNYRIAIGNTGQKTTLLAYNASTTTIANALAAIPWCKRRNITFSVTGTFNAGGTIAITVTSPETEGLEGNILKIVDSSVNSQSGTTPFAVTFDTAGEAAMTTMGTDGLFSANSTYDFNIISYKYRIFHYYGGKIVVEDL